MEVIDLKLEGLKMIKPKVFKDQRGFFLETFSQHLYEKMGNCRSFCPRQPLLFPKGLHTWNAFSVFTRTRETRSRSLWKNIRCRCRYTPPTPQLLNNGKASSSTAKTIINFLSPLGLLMDSSFLVIKHM